MSHTDWTTRFSQAGQRTTAPEISWLMAQALETPGLISLAAGFVDQTSLPNRELAPEMNRMLSDDATGRSMLQYGTTQGNLPLRETLAARLTDDGVFHPDAGVSASHFMIGSGSQQSLYLVSEALLDPGDVVIVDAPTYFVVLGAFATRGVRTIGIETDAEGMKTDELEACLADLNASGDLKRVKMLYCMTYATNPQGVTLSQPRRETMMRLLRTYRDEGFPILLLEDGAYRRLCFEEPPLPVKALDEDNDLVLYTESFSKSLSPGLRLGFGVGPQALIDKMIHFKGNHDFGSSNVSQAILLRVLEMGLFDTHVEHLRLIYKNRSELVNLYLKESLPDDVSWIVPDGGFYTWLTLPESIDTGPHSECFRKAIEEKVLFVPGSLCYSPDRDESTRSSSIRLAFGMIGDEPLQEGIRRLGRTFESVTHTVS